MICIECFETTTKISRLHQCPLCSKFTKKLLNSNNIKFFEFFTATKMHINENTQFAESFEILSKNKKCIIKSNILFFFHVSIEVLNNFR